MAKNHLESELLSWSGFGNMKKKGFYGDIANYYIRVFVKK